MHNLICYELCIIYQSIYLMHFIFYYIYIFTCKCACTASLQHPNSSLWMGSYPSQGYQGKVLWIWGKFQAQEQPFPRTARQKPDYTCELVNRGFKIFTFWNISSKIIIYAAPNCSSPQKCIQTFIYKREKCKHFPVLFSFKWFCCRPEVDSPSLKTTNTAFQWFRFHSSCGLMNLPRLDIMLRMRNMRWAETQRPIDRQENSPFTYWWRCMMWFKRRGIYVERICRASVLLLVSHSSVKTFWWKSVTCHESVWVAAKRAEVCIDDMFPLWVR